MALREDSLPSGSVQLGRKTDMLYTYTHTHTHIMKTSARRLPRPGTGEAAVHMFLHSFIQQALIDHLLYARPGSRGMGHQ